MTRSVTPGAASEEPAAERPAADETAHPGPSDSCWGLAVATAAHHRGDGEMSPEPVHHEIFQVSTMTALVEAILDGDTSYREVMKHGDFGVGTFNALDGEMAAVDGRFYHLDPDGSVKPVDPDELTPFAAVTFFRGEAEIDVTSPMARDQVLNTLDRALPSENLFYAVRVEGVFSEVTTRTVRRQRKPYPSLAAAAGGQAENRFENVSGTMVGFRAPDFAQGVTVAGYHLHFLDDARERGGHVLDFVMDSGVLLVDQDTDIHLEMPTSPLFLDAHMGAEDVNEQIRQAENVPHGG